MIIAEKAAWVFSLSYCALCGLIFAVSATIARACKRTSRASIRMRTFATGVRSRLRPGTRVPHFSAAVLGTTEKVTDACISRGRTVALLFVKPLPGFRLEFLIRTAHFVSSKVEGEVFVVCRSDEATCRAIAAKIPSTPEFDRVELLIDEHDGAAKAFLIDDRTTVVMITARRRIEKYGYPERKEQHYVETEVSQQVVGAPDK
jgi:hypothetical protein